MRIATPRLAQSAARVELPAQSPIGEHLDLPVVGGMA
jgi:hypothetical protein